MTAPTAEIEIFRVGSHVDMNGVAVDFTAADADELVAGFDPEATPAPLVVGHPETDAPAHGWVRRLRRDGDVILAELADLHAPTVEAVRAGRFRRQSASLYQRTNPSNPKPGQWTLRHVGLLGAAAPAIKGLKPVHFAAPAEPVAAFEFAAPAASARPSPEETAMAEQAAQFAEAQAALDARAAEIEARERRLAEAEAAAEAARRARVEADALSFAEGLVAAGRLAPAGVATVRGVLVALDAAQPLVFAEGQAAQSPAEALRALLLSASPIVHFGEVAGRAKAPAEAAPADLGRQAALLVERGEFKTPADAVRHLQSVNAGA